MQLQQLLADDEAVSPVIGVILMVAITVILAAVIGTFVLGLGDQISTTTPQASFTFDFDSSVDASSSPLAQNSDANTGDLTITHGGGDSVEASQLTVTDGSNSISTDTSPAFDEWSNTVSAGSSETVGVDNDDTIRVTWASSNGEETATLGKWTGPDAN